MKLEKEIREFLDRENLPYEIQRTKGSHLKIMIQDRVVFSSGTPSDPRAFENTKAHIRRVARELNLLPQKVSKVKVKRKPQSRPVQNVSWADPATIRQHLTQKEPEREPFILKKERKKPRFLPSISPEEPEVVKLRAEIAKLKAENKKLRAENKKLKKSLGISFAQWVKQ